MRGLLARWQRFVAWTSTRESPLSLALVRIGICAVLLYDLLWVGFLDLPVLLWAPEQAGGVKHVFKMDPVPLWYAFVPPESAEVWGGVMAWLLWALIVTTVTSFGAGFLTRFSGLAALLLYAQSAEINGLADRGIDRMIRIIFVLLILSGSEHALSVDAWWRTGRVAGDGRKVLAVWRYLIVGQLAIMYFAAGLSKFALSWFPWGGYSALYLILQDPTLAVTDFAFLGSPWLYWTTQLGTAVSHMWELTFPVLLFATWCRATRERSRFREWVARSRIRLVYIVVGATFHVLLAFTLRLGIFPAAMLAFYPAFFHPDELVAAWGRVTGLFRRTRKATPPESAAHG